MEKEYRPREEDTINRIIQISKDKGKKEKYNIISFESPDEARKDVGQLRIRDRIKQMVITGDAPAKYSERDRDQKIIRELLIAGYQTITVASIFFNEHLGCSNRIIKLGKKVFEEELEEANRILAPLQTKAKDTKQQQTVTEIKDSKLPAEEKLKMIQEYIINDLFMFSQAADGLYNADKKRFYVYETEEKMLMDLESTDFYCYIRDRYGIPAKDWKEIQDAIMTKIWKDGEKVEPHNFAYFDRKNFILYISDHDNGVYKLDGEKIEFVENGRDGVFFEYNTEYAPFIIDMEDVEIVPNYFKRKVRHTITNPEMVIKGENLGLKWEEFIKSNSYLKRYLIDRTNFDSDEGSLTIEEQKMLLLIYYYSLFFESALEEKPLACFVGHKESGKSFIATSIGKIFFGSKFQSRNCPESLSDIKTIIGENYYMVFDNVDHFVKSEVIDILCSAVTGVTIEKRKLYTDHEIVKVHPRIFLTITTREAKFKRDDLISRLLLFRTQKIRNPQSRALLFQSLLEHRGKILTETILNLNTILKLLKLQKDIIPRCTSRIADWETFGRKIWRGIPGLRFQLITEKQNIVKDEFGLEDDPLFIVLSHLVIGVGTNIIEEVANSLYSKLKGASEEINMEREFSKRYKSPHSMAKRLNNIKDELKRRFDIDFYRAPSNITMYTIKIKGNGAEEEEESTEILR